MGRINMARVILGGIVAGIVIDLLAYPLHDILLKNEHAEAMKALGKTMPEGGSTLVVWLIYGLVWGIAAVAVYAGFRPRFGPGAMTAIRAALVAWFFGTALTSVAMWNMTLLPISIVEIVGELIAATLATLAGSAVYREA